MATSPITTRAVITDRTINVARSGVIIGRVNFGTKTIVVLFVLIAIALRVILIVIVFVPCFVSLRSVQTVYTTMAF